MPSMHQMEAVVVGNFYINLLAQMGTDYSTPAVSLLVGHCYRATRRICRKNISLWLQSMCVPALETSIHLSATAVLFFSKLQAKTLYMALQ